MPGSLNDGISVLLVNISLKTRYSSEDWGPWTYGDSAPLTTPTVFSLDFLKHVNHSYPVNQSSSNYGSSSWSNTNWTLELIDVKSLIKTYGSVAVLLTTVEKMP